VDSAQVYIYFRGGGGEGSQRGNSSGCCTFLLPHSLTAHKHFIVYYRYWFVICTYESAPSAESVQRADSFIVRCKEAKIYSFDLIEAEE